MLRFILALFWNILCFCFNIIKKLWNVKFLRPILIIFIILFICSTYIYSTYSLDKHFDDVSKAFYYQITYCPVYYITFQWINEQKHIEKNIINSSKKYNIDANLIRALIKAESNFKPFVISRTGACGLMQLMPETAKELGVKNPFNIEQNIEGGTHYLAKLLIRFDNNKKLAIAGYNAGPNAVKRYNGVPPYKETKEHLKRVLYYYEQYKNMESGE